MYVCVCCAITEKMLDDNHSLLSKIGSKCGKCLVDGKVSDPVKGATLIGSGADVLKRVSMVGNDSAMDTGIGTCGKGGQSVPVGVGQPTMLVNNLTVGGTAAS